MASVFHTGKHRSRGLDSKRGHASTTDHKNLTNHKTTDTDCPTPIPHRNLGNMGFLILLAYRQRNKLPISRGY